MTIRSLALQTPDGGVPAIGDVPVVMGRGLAYLKDGITLAEMIGIPSEAARLTLQRDWLEEPLAPADSLTLAAFAEELQPALDAAVDAGGRPVGEAGAWLVGFSEIVNEPDRPLRLDSFHATPVHWIRDGLPLLARGLRFAAAHDLRVQLDDTWAPYWMYEPIPGDSLAFSDDTSAVFPSAMRILRGAVTLASTLGLDASEQHAILAREPIAPDDAAKLASFVRQIQPEAARLVDDNGLPTAEGQRLVGRPEIQTALVDGLIVKFDESAVRVLWIVEAGDALATFLDRAARERKTLVHATSDRWWFELTDAAHRPIRARAPRD